MTTTGNISGYTLADTADHLYCSPCRVEVSNLNLRLENISFFTRLHYPRKLQERIARCKIFLVHLGNLKSGNPGDWGLGVAAGESASRATVSCSSQSRVVSWRSLLPRKCASSNRSCPEAPSAWVAFFQRLYIFNIAHLVACREYSTVDGGLGATCREAQVSDADMPCALFSREGTLQHSRRRD